LGLFGAFPYLVRNDAGARVEAGSRNLKIDSETGGGVFGSFRATPGRLLLMQAVEPIAPQPTPDASPRKTGT